MCPSVRATLGSFSGPMTISATTAMTTISEKPMSNMMRQGCRATRGGTRLLRLFLLRLAFDRLAGSELLRGLRALRLVLRAFHAVLESLHRAAEILADVAQLRGAEDQHDDQQHDQPVPDAQSTHVPSPFIRSWASSARTAPHRRARARADAALPAARCVQC